MRKFFFFLALSLCISSLAQAVIPEGCDDDEDGYEASTGVADDQLVDCDGTDCDDTLANIYFGAPETCANLGVDNDCDGSTTDASDRTTYYADDDVDGYGDASDTRVSCTLPAGYVTNDDDCDDADEAIKPTASEACDDVDNDCDEETDEGVTTTYYADDDDDTYGDPSTTQAACTVPAHYVPRLGDCNDADATIHHGATETVNGIDDDCDGSIDEGTTTYYADTDQDGYGDADSSQEAYAAPEGYVTDNTDCDDTNAAINPVATEICDSVDNNCDASIDEGLTTYTLYHDADADTYGEAIDPLVSCYSTYSSYVSNLSDCNDTDATIYPGATETLDDGVDQDCDGVDASASNGDDPGDDDSGDEAAASSSGCSLLADGAMNPILPMVFVVLSAGGLGVIRRKSE